MLDFLKKYRLPLLALFLFAAGVLVGRACTPPAIEVEYREVIREVERSEKRAEERSVSDERTAVDTSVDTKEEAEVVVRWRTRTVYVEHPDGRKERVEEVEYDSDTRQAAEEKTERVEQKESMVVKEKDVVERKELDIDRTIDLRSEVAKAQWRVQGSVGATLSPVSAPVFGLGVERRLVGPVWIGVQGATSASVALTLSIEF